MTKYQNYQPTFVTWLGDVPSHWKLSRLKFVATSTIGITYSPDQVTTEGGTLVLRSSNIQKSRLSLEDCVYVSAKVPEKCITKVGDILICSRNGSADLVGKNILINEESAGVTFGAFMTVVRSKMYKFLYWYFNSPVFKAQSGLFSSTTINQLTNEILTNMVIAFPESPVEQLVIADFLEKKTSLIDETIRKKQRLIELLQEERTALINQAVTKGLNPEAPMKDSGITWLGEIPAHWKVTRLKHILSTQKGALKPGPFGSDLKTSDMIRDGKYKVYTQRNVIVEDVSVGEDTITEEKFKDLRGFEVTAGDILVTTRGTIGKTMVVPFNNPPGIIHPCLIRLRPDTNVVSVEWLVTYFNKTSYFKEAVNLKSNSTIIDVIYGYTLSEVQIPLPPNLEEQQEVLSHINDHWKVSEIAVTRLSREIELLQEYRTSLINEVITGKRCVLTQEQLEKLTKDQELVS